MPALDLKLIHDEMYDLELVKSDKFISICDISSTKYFAIHIDNPADNLVSSKIWDNSSINSSELLNITRTGFDNFFINDPAVYNNGNFDPTYTVTTGTTPFQFFPVSGMLTSLSYEIIQDTNSLILNGGFLEGYFKLFGYPVEYFPKRVNLGWTVDLVVEKMDLTPNGDILNTLYPDNNGFIFYMGTRAENKFSEEVNYSEIFDNAFGIRIREDGTIGYRKITIRDKCVYTKNLKKFYSFYNGGDMVIEENYSCRTAYNNGNTNDDGDTEKANRTNITATFTRDFALDGCNLIYDPYRKGTFRIYANGVLVYINHDFDEIMTRELLTSESMQETVPFYFSWGGGSQGLYESVDENGNMYINQSKPIEENFAGTYIGKLYEFRMYTRPFNFLEVRQLFEEKKNKYNLDYPV